MTVHEKPSAPGEYEDDDEEADNVLWGQIGTVVESAEKEAREMFEQ